MSELLAKVPLCRPVNRDQCGPALRVQPVCACPVAVNATDKQRRRWLECVSCCSVCAGGRVASIKAGRARRSLFETPARLSDGRMTNLRISLPPGFPAARPSLAVTHPLMHAWVRPRQRQCARLPCALEAVCWEAIFEADPARKNGAVGAVARARAAASVAHTLRRFMG